MICNSGDILFLRTNVRIYMNFSSDLFISLFFAGSAEIDHHVNRCNRLINFKDSFGRV